MMLLAVSRRCRCARCSFASASSTRSMTCWADCTASFPIALHQPALAPALAGLAPLRILVTMSEPASIAPSGPTLEATLTAWEQQLGGLERQAAAVLRGACQRL